MVDIVYHDFPSVDGPKNASWNYSALRGRYILNFKNLPYSVKWLDFPDLKPYLKAQGVPPNTEGREYTVPTIKYGDEYIVDSIAIARRLEKDYPEPSYQLDAPETKEVMGLFLHTVFPVFFVIMDRVIHKLTTPVSSQYVRNDVVEEHGKPIEAFVPAMTGDKAFDGAKESFKTLEEIVGRKGGPFVLGTEASFGDIFIMSILGMLKRCGEDDVYGRIIKDFPNLARLEVASRPWSSAIGEQ